MKRVLLSSFAALSAALLLFAPGASAFGPTQLSPLPVYGNPTISGDSVVYATADDPTGGSPKIRILSTRLGGAASELARLDTFHWPRVDLAGGSDSLIFGAGDMGDCGGGNGEFFQPCWSKANFMFGGATTLTSTASGCYPTQADFGLSQQRVEPLVAASGSRVAWAIGSTASCKAGDSVHVRDLAAPSQPDVVIPNAVGSSTAGIALAGDRLVTYAERVRTGVLTQFDARSGALLNRVELRAEMLSGISLRSDGLVALNAASARALRIPQCRFNGAALMLVGADGTVRCVASSPGIGVKLVGDQLVAYQFVGGKIGLVAQNIVSGDKKVFRYSGNSVDEPFDFDGSRVTWAQAGCLRQSIWAADVADIAAPAASPRCTVATRTKLLKIKRYRSTSLTLSCPAGCEGGLFIGGRLGVLAAKRDELGVVNELSGADPGKLTRVRLAFTPFIQRYLRRHKPKRLALEFQNWGASADGRGGPKVFKLKVRYR